MFCDAALSVWSITNETFDAARSPTYPEVRPPRRRPSHTHLFVAKLSFVQAGVEPAPCQ